MFWALVIVSWSLGSVVLPSMTLTGSYIKGEPNILAKNLF